MRRTKVSTVTGIMAVLLWIGVANPASAYDCRATDERVLQAIDEAKTRRNERRGS